MDISLLSELKAKGPCQHSNKQDTKAAVPAKDFANAIHSVGFIQFWSHFFVYCTWEMKLISNTTVPVPPFITFSPLYTLSK